MVAGHCMRFGGVDEQYTALRELLTGEGPALAVVVWTEIDV